MIDTSVNTTGAAARAAASWPSIIAGAAAALAVSLILLTLGSGVGLASVSPWPGRGVSASAITATAAAWLIFTQWVSAAVGGYLAGRLRTRWHGTHAHEVFFRDTAHGLITWSVATLITIALLGSAISASLGAGVHAAGDLASGAAQGALSQGAVSDGQHAAGSYDVDRLFRSPDASSGAQGSDPRAEAAPILAKAAATDSISDSDRTYLAQLIAAKTGITPGDAEKRIDEAMSAMIDAKTKAKAAADAAREAAAQGSLYLALSLLTGAFIASVAAAIGGRLRDEHP